MNLGINKEFFFGLPVELENPMVDNLCERIYALGMGALIYKRDLKSAFRQIPVYPVDVLLLGVHWRGHFYFNVVLPMDSLLPHTYAKELQWQYGGS